VKNALRVARVAHEETQRALTDTAAALTEAGTYLEVVLGRMRSRLAATAEREARNMAQVIGISAPRASTPRPTRPSVPRPSRASAPRPPPSVPRPPTSAPRPRPSRSSSGQSSTSIPVVE
jgi:hypothetical protein